MDFRRRSERLFFEIMLICVLMGIVTMFAALDGYRLIVLNLFYLPIILGAFCVGRGYSGTLALLSALVVGIASIAVPPSWTAALENPIVAALTLLIWSATLGLASILVGTLADERSRTVQELQRAYIGIAEVLSKYLHGARADTETSATRVARLSCEVARELQYPPKQIDHVRVAALLHDLDDIEVTTSVISKAVGALDGEVNASRRSFMGTELVNSLSSVLEGALPLLVSQDDAVSDYLSNDGTTSAASVPLGAEIIRVCRRYDQLTVGGGPHSATPVDAVRDLRCECRVQARSVVDALELVVSRETPHCLSGQSTSGTGQNAETETCHIPV